MYAATASLSINDDAFPLLAGQRGPLSFAVYVGADAPAQIVGRYASLAYRTIAAHPAMLRSFDFDRIASAENLLVFVCRDGAPPEEDLLAAAYVHAEVRGDRRVLVHKGYVSSGRERGLARVMIAALHIADIYRLKVPADGEAVARILRDGNINVASSTPFSDAGYHGVRNYAARIGARDAHLEPFAEKRPDGFWVGCHLMEGKAEKIAARAEDILADWALTWGSLDKRAASAAGQPA